MVKEKKIEEKKIEGIGGWLIIPIIGFFLTIALQLVDFLDSWIYYYLEDVVIYMAGNLFLIAFATVALIMIFLKKKEAKTWAIVTLSISALSNLVYASYIGAIAGFIWIMYFLKSERVKNTFVN